MKKAKKKKIKKKMWGMLCIGQKKSNLLGACNSKLDLDLLLHAKFYKSTKCCKHKVIPVTVEYSL